jgi:hypothetical protein
MLWGCKGPTKKTLSGEPTPSLRVAPQHRPDNGQLAAEAHRWSLRCPGLKGCLKVLRGSWHRVNREFPRSRIGRSELGGFARSRQVRHELAQVSFLTPQAL